jgi:hypothetical protein
MKTMVDLTKADLADEIERQRQTWQFKAVEATHGNQTLVGCIVLAVIGKAASNPPWIGPTAIISRDGDVFANMTSKRDVEPGPTYIAPIGALVDTWRKLADSLDISDADREAMFLELRKWISHDFRAITDPEHKLG